MIVGQHVRLSTIRCYEVIRPRWKSLGFASALIGVIVLTYYGALVANTLPNIFYSLESPLPWIEQGAESFWMEKVLNRWPDFSKSQGTGPIQWNLALSLAVFWAITYWSAAFGKKFLSKITYVTVILPVILTAILVARSVVLDGAWDGISFLHTQV
jgi:SNF family Na+-dependent transporter